MASTAVRPGAQTEGATANIPLVIAASSLGTVFEWYDFFIYGTLAASGIIGATFFPAGNETLQTLLAWAGFAVGFGFRPLGAILFGYLGDKLGRKYTFLVTITLMGVATAGVGLIPSAASIGIAAPILIIGLRIAQGLALGGEYGGAAIYVAEHAPPRRRGYFTSFIQASVAGGFILSLAVVLLTKGAMSTDAFADWGWRIPFLLSLVLLAVSLWMRLKLSESPVFKAMKAAGETAGNPFVESFTHPGNLKRLFVALFGVAAGLTVDLVHRHVLHPLFLHGSHARGRDGRAADGGRGRTVRTGVLHPVRPVERPGGSTAAHPVGLCSDAGPAVPDLLGHGRARQPGTEHGGGAGAGDHRLHRLRLRSLRGRAGDPCGRVIGALGELGIQYGFSGMAEEADGPVPLTLGERALNITDAAELKPALEAAGYDFSPVVPSTGRIALIIACVVAMSALAGGHLRSGRRRADRAVSGAHPLQLHVDPLPHRHGLFRRFPAVSSPR